MFGDFVIPVRILSEEYVGDARANGATPITDDKRRTLAVVWSRVRRHVSYRNGLYLPVKLLTNLLRPVYSPCVIRK